MSLSAIDRLTILADRLAVPPNKGGLTQPQVDRIIARVNLRIKANWKK